MRNKPTYLLILLFLALILTACGGAALAQGTETTSAEENVARTLSVRGIGKVSLTPDIAYITIGVHTEGADAAETVASNTGQTQELVDALKAAGVAEKDLQTTNFSIYPRQDVDERGQPTGEITYIVDNSIFVTVRELDNIGELLDAAVAAGANNIFGITFDVEDRTEALTEARQAAVADAQVQAQDLAQAAGVTLGDVQTITTLSSPTPLVEGKGGGGVMLAESVSVPVSPGQMTISVEVTMVYEIR